MKNPPREHQGEILKHRSQIPKIHRAVYDKAMKGKSMKSAVKSFCLECVHWQKEEVRLCGSFCCALWMYRPYKVRQKQAPESISLGAESKKAAGE